MKTAIRTATVRDTEAIGRMTAEFHRYLRSIGDPTAFSFGSDAYVRDGFGGDPAFAGLVAEQGGRVVGYLLYTFTYDADRGDRLLHVVDLFVQQGARRAGAGRALMDGAAAVARTRGATGLLWSVYKGNALAIRFYEGLGARRVHDLHFMYLDLD